MKIDIHLTDTFGGEPNYSWVRRYSIEVPKQISDLAMMHRIKKVAGLNGVRCTVSRYGDSLELRPEGRCMVLFANF
jgi:hypothetical protein